MEGQAGDVVDLEQEVRPEGDPRYRLGAVGAAAHTGQLDALHPGGQGVTGREVPLLVKLPVGGQIGLGGDTAHPSALNDQGAVVETVPQTQGRADDEGGQEVCAGGAQGLDGGEHVGQEDIGQEEVVDGVAGQAQLGEGGQADTVVGQGAGLLDDGGGVGSRIDRHHGQGDGGDTGEALVVGGEELDGGSRISHGVGHGGRHSLGHGVDPSIDGEFLRDHRPRFAAGDIGRAGVRPIAGGDVRRVREQEFCPWTRAMALARQRTAPTTSPVEPGAARWAQSITHACARGTAWNRWRQGRARVRRKRVTERRQERSSEESEETAITFLSMGPKTSTSLAGVGGRESGTGRVIAALKAAADLRGPGRSARTRPGEPRPVSTERGRDPRA